MTLNWDHTWTGGTPFEDIHHLVLYDFAIHWFDAARSFFPGCDATSVSATVARFPDQPIKPPLLARAAITFPQGMATLSFNGCCRFGARETCTITGTKGTLHATGEICGISSVDIITDEGVATAELEGSWFPDGFRGCMGELLCAIEEDRDPENSAADNLKSLAIALAAMSSADLGRPVAV
jgi:predicted dehydrogenase